MGLFPKYHSLYKKKHRAGTNAFSPFYRCGSQDTWGELNRWQGLHKKAVADVWIRHRSSHFCSFTQICQHLREGRFWYFFFFHCIFTKRKCSQFIELENIIFFQLSKRTYSKIASSLNCIKKKVKKLSVRINKWDLQQASRKACVLQMKCILLDCCVRKESHPGPIYQLIFVLVMKNQLKNKQWGIGWWI